MEDEVVEEEEKEAEEKGASKVNMLAEMRKSVCGYCLCAGTLCNG